MIGWKRKQWLTSYCGIKWVKLFSPYKNGWKINSFNWYKHVTYELQFDKIEDKEVLRLKIYGIIPLSKL